MRSRTFTIILVLMLTMIMAGSFSVSYAEDGFGTDDDEFGPDTEDKKISSVVLSRSSYVFSGNVKTPKVTVYNQNGNVLSSKYYDTQYSKGRINAGKYKVYVTGKNGYAGKIVARFTIKPQQLKKSRVYLSKKKYVYNGKVKKPVVSVENAKGITLKKAGKYSVSYASGRKNVGKYKVIIKGKNNYKGSVTKYFKINPKGTYIKSLSSNKNTITVKWKKQSTRMSKSHITGYQIKYSDDSSMCDYSIKTVKGYSKTSKQISGLSWDERYYVKIRTYKTVNGVKYYSTWSSKKSVSTKEKPITNPVYIAPYSGERYHYNRNCRGLRNARYIEKISLSDAKSYGYTLCGYER
ncbi:MAG: fibronectin type III domain-containing protein [Parasporobacterium sp.]|nr:fibronectin type III domain-containing protein [Parasporobacterium sp.]